MIKQKGSSTFRKFHYEYVADTIINDPDLTATNKQRCYHWMGTVFERDFDNFNIERWKKRWIDRFH